MATTNTSTLQGDNHSRGTATPETNRSVEVLPEDITSDTSDTSDTSNVEKFGAPAGPPPGMRPEDFPDGGKDAWLCVLGGWFGMFCTFGMINCTGVFLEYYVTGPLASYGPSSASWIVSTQIFMLMGATALWGFLFDCYGARWLLIGGTVTYVFGLVMTSLCTQYWQFFLAEAIVVGASSGAVFNVCTATIPTWFRRKRALAFGIIASGSSIGGVVLPIALTQLTARIGFPWALRAVALIILALCGISCLTVKSRLQPQPRPLVWAVYTQPLREPPFVLFVAGAFLFLLGLYIPPNYVTLEAEAAGVAPALAAYLLPILNAASTAGRILPGMLADRIGSFNTITMVSLLSGVLVLGIWLPLGHSLGGGPIIAFSALYGFASGGFVSLAPACIAQISDVRYIGVRTGTAFLILAIGALVGPPIAGALLAAMGGHSYLGVQLFAGLSMVLGVVVWCVARVAQVGTRFLVKF